MEVWKKIPQFNNEYEVSNTGKIRSVYGVIVRSNGVKHTRVSKVLKPSVDNGYLKGAVCVNKKMKPYKVHRLVAQMFVDNPENKPEVNHIDGDKQNNNANNLEWTTRKENIEHCHRLGLQKPFKGEEVGTSILTAKEVLEIRSKFVPRKYSRSKLAKEYNVSEGCIKDILYKRTWNHL